MTNLTDKDFTITGTKIEGAYENDRNAQNCELFKSIIREAFGVQDTLIGHHLLYVKVDKQPDPEHPGNFFNIQVVQEIPSADALIFDHEVAKAIWGDQWQAALTRLALEPVATRDQLLAAMYAARKIDPVAVKYAVPTTAALEEIQHDNAAADHMEKALG